MLERDIRLPLVLLLPQEERSGFYVQAPDLWAIRSYSIDLPEPAKPEPSEAPVGSSSRPQYVPTLGAPPGLAEVEWTRLWGGAGDRDQLDPADGFAAFESASERGDLLAAKAIAAEALELTRGQSARSEQPLHSRNLSIALNNVGRVERDLGNLEAARGAYRESLELRRRLREALGETPQVLRDLSVSLNNVGRVERDLGNLEAARGAYRESLELCRRLRETFSDHPQVVRDLSRIEANCAALEARAQAQ